MESLESLQEAIDHQIDKLQALTSIWISIGNSDQSPPMSTQIFYAIVIDDLLEQLRRLTVQLNQTMVEGNQR